MAWAKKGELPLATSIEHQPAMLLRQFHTFSDFWIPGTEDYHQLHSNGVEWFKVAHPHEAV